MIRSVMLSLALGAAGSLLPIPSFAACSCECINGSVQAVCSNSLDIRPICPPRICPIVPPSIQPIQTPYIPPIGTSGCRQEQVLNPYTNQYEWRSICR